MSNWYMERHNDALPVANGDEIYSEWWTVTDGARSFRVDSGEADAEWLKAALERAGDVPEAGDLSWEARERTIAEGKRMAGLPVALQMTTAEMETVARRVVGANASAVEAAVPLVEAALRSVPLRLDIEAASAPARLLSYEDKEAIAAIVIMDNDPVSMVTAIRVVDETLHAVAGRLEQPVAWRRKRYDAPDAPWVYRETPPQPDPADRLNLPYEPLYRGPRNV